MWKKDETVARIVDGCEMLENSDYLNRNNRIASQILVLGSLWKKGMDLKDRNNNGSTRWKQFWKMNFPKFYGTSTYKNSAPPPRHRTKLSVASPYILRRLLICYA